MNVTLFKTLNGNKLYPSKAYLNDSGYDVYLPKDIIIEPRKAGRFKLDIAINWSFDMRDVTVMTFPRSSSLLDGKIFFTTGIIDYGYDGSIHLTCTNISDETVVLKQGERVMQLLFVKLYEHVDMSKILKDGIRGKSAFGSSGK
jgi:deoxyuridine 5'-triphosphate nucleotidohydrolase